MCYCKDCKSYCSCAVFASFGLFSYTVYVSLPDEPDETELRDKDFMGDANAIANDSNTTAEEAEL